MNQLEAILQRHSVRAYTDKPVPVPAARRLEELAARCNREGDLHIQLMLGEPRAFSTWRARYGGFRNVANYFAVVGRDDTPLFDLRCGYQGERLVLAAQQEGLNTCWVAISFSRRRCPVQLGRGEKIAFAITLGYGVDQGTPHVSRPIETLCALPQGLSLAQAPEWFRAGMQAASLAPTAVNAQNFLVRLHDDLRHVSVRPTSGAYAETGTGIARCHFEAGAGRGNFDWAD